MTGFDIGSPSHVMSIVAPHGMALKPGSVFVAWSEGDATVWL